MRRLKTMGLLALCVVLSVVLFAGCSSSTAEEQQGRAVEEETPEPTEEPTPEPTQTEEATPQPSESEFLYKELGNKTEQSGSFLLTNSTDFVLKSLEISEPDASDEQDSVVYGSNLVSSDTSIQQGETVCIYYTKPKDDDSLDADDGIDLDDDARDILFDDDFYSIRMETDAGKELVLYDVDLPDLETCFLRYDEEGDVAYIEYQSLSSNETVNTLESQLFMKDLMSGAIEESQSASASAPSSTRAANADSSQSSSGSGTGSTSGGASSGGSSSADSSSSGNESSAGSEGSSGSDASDSSSGDSSGSSSGEDDWGSSEEMGGSDDCLEDNIIWND